MKRLTIFAAALIIMAVCGPAPADAQTETSVTGAGAGLFPEGVTLLGVPLSSVQLGMGLGVAGTWAVGQFQTTLTGVTALGQEQNIVVEGLVNGSVPSGPNTAIFSGISTVDPGDGTPPVAGVPFTASVAANADGTGSLALTLGATSLPAAAINEGYVTVQQP
jgi:hypothetical protein